VPCGVQVMSASKRTQKRTRCKCKRCQEDRQICRKIGKLVLPSREAVYLLAMARSAMILRGERDD